MFARGLGYNTYVYTSFATCIVIIVYYNFIINIKVHDCKGKSCLEIFRISPKSLSLAYTNPSTKIQHLRINSKMRHPFDIENEEENIRGRIYLIVNWKMNLQRSKSLLASSNRFFIERSYLFSFYFSFFQISLFKFIRRDISISSFQFPLLLFFSLFCKLSSMFNFLFFLSGIALCIEQKGKATNYFQIHQIRRFFT